jgi:hypothetical protein
MKLGQIYEMAVENGIAKDPRGKDEVSMVLEETRKDYEGLKGDDKKFFDKDKLWNPFADTRILYGEPELEIEYILAGIDVETPELMLADRLRERGRRIDLCLSHHPEGRALADLADVMALQADIWAEFGVPINIADALISDRMKEIRRGLLPQNHQRPIDCARLLDIPFMCVHTPADNMVTDYLGGLLRRKKPRLVGDVIDILLGEKEYRDAAAKGMPPTVLVGDKKRRCGRILVDMTGGTGGPASMIEKLANAGVGTMVGMHMGDKLRKEAEKHHLNVVIAGHIASDSIGLNLYLDGLRAKGVNSSGFSGFNRYSRSPKKKSPKSSGRGSRSKKN